MLKISKNSHQPRVRKAVGAIIYQSKGNSKEFLLIKKSKIMDSKESLRIRGYWDFPKGGIKKGERPLSALKREIMEELGTKNIVVKKKLSRDLRFNFPKKIASRINYDSQVTKLYLIQFVGEESNIKIDNDEVSDWTFLPLIDAIKKLGKKESKEIYKKLL